MGYEVGLPVDSGIFILLPIILILFTIFKNLRNKTWENWMLFITASMSIIAGSVMISSLVYFLPFYLFFFLIYINLSSEKGSLYLD